MHGAVGIILPVMLNGLYFTVAAPGRLASPPGTQQTAGDQYSLRRKYWHV